MTFNIQTPGEDPNRPFGLSDLNPLGGTAIDPFGEEDVGMRGDRQGLIDTFGQEGLGKGLEQLVTMVTPQSLYSRNPSTASIMRDFVEFSPIGDIRDVVTSLTLTNNLDPLERAIGLLPFVPAVAFTANMTNNVGSFVAKRRIRKALEGMASFSEPDVAVVHESLAEVYSARTDTDGLAKAGKKVAKESGKEIRRRQELDANRRRRLAAGDKQYRWFATDSFSELAIAIAEEGYKGSVEEGRVARLAADLEQVGQAVVQEMPDTFANVDPAAAALAASQWAVSTYANLADAGILRLHDPNSVSEARMVRQLHPDSFDVYEDLLDLDDVKGGYIQHSRGLLLQRMVGTTLALGKAGIGPNLATDPQYSLVAVVVPAEGSFRRELAPDAPNMSNPSGEQVQVVIAANDLLPDVRIIDADGRITNFGELRRRMNRVDWKTIQPDITANLIKWWRLASGEWDLEGLNQEALRLGRSWYRNAHNTAAYLAKKTNIPLGNVAALFSGISMQSAWAPNNLVAGTHTLLQYGFPDLDTKSPEYRQMFIDAINSGGWGATLLAESNEELRTRFKDNPDGIVAYYADPDNFQTSTGSGLIGMEDRVKQQNAILAGLARVPPEMVVRMAKTNNFMAAIMDPESMEFLAVDVHQWTAAVGFEGLEALSSKGRSKLKMVEIEKGTYQFPSGRRFTLEMLEEGIEKLRAAEGLSDAEVAAIEKRFRMVPDKRSQAIYDAIYEATAQAAWEIGIYDPEMAVPSRFQSTIWEAIRRVRGHNQTEKMGYYYGLKRGKGSSSAAFEKGSKGKVYESDIPEHMQGNPKYAKSLAQTTAQASSDLTSVIPESVLEGMDTSRSPAVVTVRPDGSSEVWADVENPSVMDSLRHLRPVPSQKVGGWTRMVPKEPEFVTSHQDKVRALLADTEVSGEIRVYPSNAAPGLAPGNYAVVEALDPAVKGDLIDDLLSMDVPVRVSEQTVAIQPSTIGSVPLSDVASMTVEQLEDPKTSPFITNDWVAISAYVDAETANLAPGLALERYNRSQHVRLREALVSAVREQFRVDRATAESMVLEAEGKWGGTSEPSFVVFGLSYKTAFKLGQEFNQWAVATRNAMVATRGDGAGNFEAASDEGWKFGPEAASGDHSLVQIGGKHVAFSSAYQSDTTTDVDFETMQGAHHVDGAATSILVDLDMGDGYAPAGAMDRIFDVARRHGAKVAGYTTGEMHRPAQDVVAVEEQVYTDGNVAFSYRSRWSGRNPHAVKAWVPREQATGLTKPSGRESVRSRTKREVSAEAAASTDRFLAGGEVRLGTVTVKHSFGAVDRVKDVRKGVLEWRFERGGTTVGGTHFTIDFSGQSPVVTIGDETLPGQVNRPGLVGGEVVRGVANLMVDDPNLTLRAADTLALLGYKTKGFEWDIQTEPRLRTEGRSGIERGSSSWRANRTPLDVERSQTLASRHNVPFRLTFDETIATTPLAEDLMATIDGVMSPERAPSFLKPLHGQGLTLAPHILSTDVLGGGINLGVQRSEMGIATAGFGTSSLGSASWGIGVGLAWLQAAADWGSATLKRAQELRSKKHFSTRNTDVGLMEHALVHEIGHAVWFYVSSVAQGEDFAFVHRQTALMRKMGLFGTSNHSSTYGFGLKGPDVAEFFAEAFVGVATGAVTDPALVDMVRDVVTIGNSITPSQAARLLSDEQVGLFREMNARLDKAAELPYVRGKDFGTTE